MRCIALLRGINVSGRRTVHMTDLKRAFEELGFENVSTYGQSGNVVFDSHAKSVYHATHIEEKLSESFWLSTNVFIRTQQELERIIENNPLIHEQDIAIDKLHVTFLLDKPDASVASNLDIRPDDGEKFVVIGKEVYLYCPNGYARTKLNNAAFEKKLNTLATTRNWKTTNKLVSKLKEL
ncbi:MAG: DUF1697 domain-containing protein [Euryarchaeota archaeon]|nr:DUF1697 domain-containing protein [Euryarchaeota archaeon]